VGPFPFCIREFWIHHIFIAIDDVYVVGKKESLQFVF